MLEEEDILLISKKIEGKLSEREEQIFDEKYATDREFKEEAVSRTQVLAGIEAMRKKALKEELSGWLMSEENPMTAGEQSQNSVPQIRWYLYAAAALVPLILTVILLLPGPSKTAEELFAENFQPLENILGNRAGQSHEFLDKGMQLYRAGEYAAAITELEKISNQDDLINLYLGISYLATGDTDSARDHFEYNRQQGDKVMSEYATWYLALTFLKEENFDRAQTLLETLVADKAIDYADDASLLIKEIQSLK